MLTATFSPRCAGGLGEGLEGVGGLGLPERQDQSDRELASVRHSRGGILLPFPVHPIDRA